MKKLITTALLGGAVAASLIGAGAANADSNDFVTHVRAVGFNGSDAVLANAGEKLCAAMRTGTPISMAQTLSQIVFAPKGYTTEQSNQFVAYAISDVC